MTCGCVGEGSLLRRASTASGCGKRLSLLLQDHGNQSKAYIIIRLAGIHRHDLTITVQNIDLEPDWSRLHSHLAQGNEAIRATCALHQDAFLANLQERTSALLEPDHF